MQLSRTIYIYWYIRKSLLYILAYFICTKECHLNDHFIYFFKIWNNALDKLGSRVEYECCIHACFYLTAMWLCRGAECIASGYFAIEMRPLQCIQYCIYILIYVTLHLIIQVFYNKINIFLFFTVKIYHWNQNKLLSKNKFENNWIYLFIHREYTHWWWKSYCIIII